MKNNPAIVAASLLAADFSRLGEESTTVIQSGADWLHLDVMDNHYVPNLTFGAPVCAALARVVSAPMDVHLMTTHPESFILPFAEAGASRLTFHPDSTEHAHRTAVAIRTAGMKPGIAYNPAVPPVDLPYMLEVVDLVLLMTVNPGFGGQSFIPTVLPKISEVRQQIDDSGRDIILQVDGGINAQTATACRNMGADALVAGSSIFASENYATAISQLRGDK